MSALFDLADLSDQLFKFRPREAQPFHPIFDFSRVIEIDADGADLIGILIGARPDRFHDQLRLHACRESSRPTGEAKQSSVQDNFAAALANGYASRLSMSFAFAVRPATGKPRRSGVPYQLVIQ
jgi:hypothetical protein